MRNLVIATVVATALCGCVTHDPLVAGEPEMALMPGGAWIQGASNAAQVNWTTTCDESSDDWFCQTSTITLLDVSCKACTVLDAPIGQAMLRQITAHATATSDDPLGVVMTVRFDSTGAVRTLSAATVGDHDVGFEATCQLVDGHAVATYAAVEFRDCSTPRQPDDVVVVVPRIHTFRGDARFAMSALSISPTPTAWRSVDATTTFGVLPIPDAGGPVSVTAQLSTGEMATVTFDAPALADPSAD